jgi:peptidoglycan/LPS O-acetylase OafA/YrhL
VLLVLSGKVAASLARPLPSVPQTLAHLIYAQEMLGYGDIVSVFWSLCYEIQFYLLFITLLVLWQRARGFEFPRVRRGAAIVVLSGLFAISLVLRYSGHHLPVPGVALERWFQFFLGVLTYWVISKRVAPSYLGLAYILYVAAMAAYHVNVTELLSLVVSLSVLLLGRRDLLDSVFASRPLQFMGRISYSFYLIHVPIGWRWISLLERVKGSGFGLGWAWIAFASACGITIGASTLMWWLIELPTTRLSKRIRLPSRRAQEGVEEQPSAGTILSPAYPTDGA